MQIAHRLFFTAVFTFLSGTEAAPAQTPTHPQSDANRLQALVEQQGKMLAEQGARLNELERQNRDLRDMLLEIKRSADMAVVLATNAAATPRLPAAAPSTTQPRYAFTKPNGFEVVPYGYFKFDAIYDSARTAFGDAAVYAVPKSLSGGGEEDVTFSARETRLGFNVKAPETSHLKVTGRLEADFYGDLANQDSYQFRLRLAYLDAAWGDGWSVRLGQDWDAYTSFHPKMLDAGILAGTGHLYGRRPQARFTKVTALSDTTRLTVKTAVENGYKNDTDSDGQQDSNASGIPQFVGQAALETRLLTKRDTTLAVSGVYGEEETRKAPNPDTYTVEMVLLAAQFPLTDPFTLQGTLWSGKNLDAYYAGVLQGINLTHGTEVAATGGWLEGVYDINDRLSLGLGYGLDNPEDGDLSLSTARTMNQRYFAAVFYKLTSSLMIGGEYSVIKTDFKNEADVTDNRLQFSGQLSF
ncbi:MAG TPA: hypothetical protein PKM57_05855 [Kiritimatiellia bacterium]|nr:hypothetical protein [Kiritimatiellia bacterium]HPS07211.1 hypothetical protein [Kiritimatiellia bacterium]